MVMQLKLVQPRRKPLSSRLEDLDREVDGNIALKNHIHSKVHHRRAEWNYISKEHREKSTSKLKGPRHELLS